MSDKKYLDSEGLKALVKKIKTGLSAKVDSAVLLDDSGMINASVLPGYVDDVMEFTGTVKGVKVDQSHGSDYVRTGVVYDTEAQKFYGVFRTGETFSMLHYLNFTAPIDTEKDEIAGINAPGAGTPERGKIYVDITANKSYRWSGSQLVEITGGGVTLGETSSTAYAGDKGAKNAADIANIMEGDLPVTVPVIVSGSTGALWSIADSEGNSAGEETATNITETYGMRVSFNGCYQWVPTKGHKIPTAVAGGNWADFPESGVKSSTLSVGDIVTDRTFSVKLSAPAQGLVYVGGKIRKASESDLDYASASASVHFKYKTVFGSVDSAAVSAETLQGLLSSSFELADNRKKTATGVTTASDKHLVYAYPSVLGELSKIVMNDAVPLLADGFKLSKVTVKDPVTKATLVYDVYTSVQKGAFTNAKLEIA